jgi:hypothetical protein
MKQCPLCYTFLELRKVGPCYICVGDEELIPKREDFFTEFRLPNGQLIVLCRRCQLEEFMVRGGWGYRLIQNEKLPINGLHEVCNSISYSIGEDKYCPSCNFRLAFLKIVEAHQNGS